MKKNSLLTLFTLTVMHLSLGQPEFHGDTQLSSGPDEIELTYYADKPSASDQNGEIEGFKLFPNPVTNGYVTISTKRNLSKSISIYDVLGKEVLRTQIAGNSLDVTKLTAGVYLMKVSEDGASSTRKLVIR